MQTALGIVAAALFVSILLCFPETSHPGARGIDKLQSESSLRLGGDKLRSGPVIFLNPFKPLMLLRSPNLFAVCVAGATVLLCEYVLTVPLAHTIGSRYGIVNEALIGMCILPHAVGCSIGAPLGGRISDNIVVQWRKRRGGEWYPEDRLRAAVPCTLFLIPISTLLSGLLVKFVPGQVGLILNLVCLLVNGIGIDMTLSLFAAYGVDILHDRSAEVVAAYTAFRSLFVSIALIRIFPMVDTLGVATVDFLTALLVWVGCLCLYCTIRFGSQMRAWIDIGYSTAENN